MTYNVRCENGKVTSVAEKDRDSHTGKEGPFQAPDGTFLKVVTNVNDGVGEMGYVFAGRPPLAVEPSFQLLHLRLCPYIWHLPFIKITKCGKAGWEGQWFFGGSKFPTRKFWVNSNEATARIVQQGDISALWKCSSAHGSLVGGDWVNGFPY